MIRCGPEEWKLGLPRLLLQQAVRDGIAPDRRTVAAGPVLQSAVICGHMSALTLLVRENTAPEILDAFGSWRCRLNEIR